MYAPMQEPKLSRHDGVGLAPLDSVLTALPRAPDLLFDLRTGADYLEIDIDIGSSQIAAGVVRLCGGYAKALVVDISFVIEGKRDDELPEQILGTIQIRNLDVTKGRPLPT